MRLLLVEDDRALADELQSVLVAAGYAVDRARDGEDALYLGQTEDYDLVILDLGLPRLSGIDVLAGWRTEGRTMPVLILTARDTWREKVLGLKAGADDYLTKPGRCCAGHTAAQRPRSPRMPLRSMRIISASCWRTEAASSSPERNSACCATSCSMLEGPSPRRC